MEVHTHTHKVPDAHNHRGRKRWTHYFWEFLMLFLAVFCGFLAENYREHFVEHQREKLLARNLYEEIVADSIAVQQKLSFRKKKEEECSYFIKYVKDSSLTNLSPRFYYAFTWAFIQTTQLMFDPNDGVMNQLRNSGELRYFKSTGFQSQIGNLSVMIANARSRNEREYSYVEFYLRPFTIKHFDFTWYDSLTEHGNLTLINALNQQKYNSYAGRIINADMFSRQEAQNIAYYYLLMLRSTRQGYYINYALANHQLLDILRKEYHLN